MKRKITYETPSALRRVPLMLEDAILGPSIVYNTEIISMGQAVENHDFSDGNTGSYTAEWE